MSQNENKVNAPELYGTHWFNGDPVSIAESRGEVIILFFWDYVDIKSLRLLHYVRNFTERYREIGVKTVGIHVPEFEFAAKPDSVEKVLRDLNITFSVVMDNEKSISEQFSVREIPAIILVDSTGIIHERFTGRGRQLSIERSLQHLLRESGKKEDLPLPMDSLRQEEIPGVQCYQETPKILFGYLKGNLGNQEGYNPESVFTYNDPGAYLPGRFYLHGKWRSEKNCMVSENDDGNESFILLKYAGKEVFAVTGYRDGERGSVEVTQNEEYLTGENRGEDIMLDGEQRSIIEVSSPRLVNVVSNKGASEWYLKFIPLGAGVEFYSLTFIPGVVPELLSSN